MLTKVLRRLEDTILPYVGTPLCPEKDIVLIAGGSDGIGWELVTIFTTLNFKVVIVDKRYPEKLKNYDNVAYYNCEVSQFAATRQILNDVKEKFGTISIYINTVALKHLSDKLMSVLHLEELMRTVYAGHLNIIQTVLPDMLQVGRGYIVDIASIEGIGTSSDKSMYGSIQATKISLQRELTKEVNQLFGKTTGFGNGHIRNLLILSSRALNFKQKQDYDTARRIYRALTHNRQGVMGISMRSKWLLTIREQDWHWYQAFKLLPVF